MGFKNILDYVIDVVVKVVAISSSPSTMRWWPQPGARAAQERVKEKAIFFSQLTRRQRLQEGGCEKKRHLRNWDDVIVFFYLSTIRHMLRLFMRFPGKITIEVYPRINCNREGSSDFPGKITLDFNPQSLHGNCGVILRVMACFPGKFFESENRG